MPLPGTKIIHRRLLDYVRPVEGNALPDRCVITAPAAGTTNPTTGVYTPGTTVIYPVVDGDGACRVQPEQRFVRDIDRGDADVTISRFYASIPFDAPTIPLEAVLTVTASSDADLVDTTFVVRDVGVDTFQSRRLLTLERRPKRVPT